MAHYYKIGLLILNSDHTKFLVCEKAPEHVTADYIMPGGKLEEGSDLQCLRNEIQEELNSKIDEESLTVVGEYTDVAAGRPDRKVRIKLYQGSIMSEPIPSTEIRKLHWIGKEDIDNGQVSPIVKNKIIPDLVTRKILL